MVVVAEPGNRHYVLKGESAADARDQRHRAQALDGSRVALILTLGSFWRAQAAGWLFWALFGFTSRVLVFQDAALALTLTAVLEPLGFALTALAHYAFRNRTGRGITLTVVAVALVLSVAGGLLQMQVANGIKGAMLWMGGTGIAAGGAAIAAVYYTLIFLGWSLAYLWVKAAANEHSERIRRSQAQQAVLEAELHRLRLQLDSHLLFNALNTVAMEIPERPDAALEMTHRIASYLRYSLDRHSWRICPLADEIEAMRAYVRIHELRFEGRLDCAVEMEPAAGSIAVPHLILQPLVENAVKHGLQSPAVRFTVAIFVEHKDDDLVIEVRNPGRLTTAERDRPAVGLANVRRRLELHYPLRHELSVTQACDTVVARLTLWGPTCFA